MDSGAKSGREQPMYTPSSEKTLVILLYRIRVGDKATNA
jgi:hypothetical protein